MPEKESLLGGEKTVGAVGGVGTPVRDEGDRAAQGVGDPGHEVAGVGNGLSAGGAFGEAGMAFGADRTAVGVDGSAVDLDGTAVGLGEPAVGLGSGALGRTYAAVGSAGVPIEVTETALGPAHRASWGSGRLAGQQGREGERVDGWGGVGGARQAGWAEAVPAGRGPVTDRGDQGRTARGKRDAKGAGVGRGEVRLACPAAEQVLHGGGLGGGVRVGVFQKVPGVVARPLGLESAAALLGN
jgi:hypothetical protein